MNNNNDKQRLLIEYLISSTDTFALCKSIVKPEYFDPEYRKAVDFIHMYYDKYSNTPSPQQVAAETGAQFTRQEITRDQITYCTDEIEVFCRRRALQQAVVQAPKFIAEEDYGKFEQMIKDAVSISLNRQLGLSYFENPLARLQEMAKVPQRTPVLGREFDDLMGGGLARTEMILVSANSGGGKSITLANIAMNFLAQPKVPGSKQKMDVLYLSLELSEEMIAQRFDTMFTGIPSVRWRENYENIAEMVLDAGEQLGRLTIKRMGSGTTANQIRGYLKEFELKNGYVPDLLVVDYLDLMGANEHVSADNISEKDKRATEQLRDILFDYKMYGATASQQNRSAVDATELNHSHIAGGLTKINTVDWYVSIVMNPMMKAAGEIMFVFLKTRSSDGVGKRVTMRWINDQLRISDFPKSKEDLSVFQRSNPTSSGNKPRTLLDSFDVGPEE